MSQSKIIDLTRNFGYEIRSPQGKRGKSQSLKLNNLMSKDVNKKNQLDTKTK